MQTACWRDWKNRGPRDSMFHLRSTPYWPTATARTELSRSPISASRKLNDLQLADSPLIAVIEGVEKPGNLGAVIRSADGAGVTAVIVADGGSDLYNPNVIRASMGTVFTLPICVASNAEALAWLRSHKLAIYAARVDGSVDYTACDYTAACAIILGSESDGLSDAWRGDDITADSPADARSRRQSQSLHHRRGAVLRSATATVRQRLSIDLQSAFTGQVLLPKLSERFHLFSFLVGWRFHRLSMHELLTVDLAEAITERAVSVVI